MKKAIGLLAVLIGLVGCSGSPGNVAVDYLENMRDGKFNEAAELSVKTAKNNAKKMASLSEGERKSHVEKAKDTVYTVINARVQSRNATVEVKKTLGERITTNVVTLVDEDWRGRGDWRVQNVK